MMVDVVLLHNFLFYNFFLPVKLTGSKQVRIKFRGGWRREIT